MSPPATPPDETCIAPMRSRARSSADPARAPAAATELTPWRFVPDQMVDACLWIDPDQGRILDCNPALTQALGYDCADLVGQPLECLAADDDAGRNPGPWQAMARGLELADADINVAARGGAVLAMSASSSRLRSHQGEAACGLVVWRDVSRRRQSEMTLVESQRRLKTLAYELTLAESRERARIAQGLHDEIGQLLTMAHFRLDEWAAASGDSAPKPLALIKDLGALLKQAAQATRSATFDLFCPLLRPLGLQSALEGMAQRVARSSRMAVRLEGTLPALSLPEPVQAVLFRVVRELALNAQKHARARELRIILGCAADELSVRVADDGCGFEPDPMTCEFSPAGGFGLPSAEAQMQAVGGRLEIETAPGKGTCATVVLPLGAPA